MERLPTNAQTPRILPGSPLTPLTHSMVWQTRPTALLYESGKILHFLSSSQRFISFLRFKARVGWLVGWLGGWVGGWVGGVGLGWVGLGWVGLVESQPCESPRFCQSQVALSPLVVRGRRCNHPE